jgi:RHS repeat-associated protein
VDQNLYVTQDANWSTTATLNGATGAVQNRFTYTPYGRRTVLNSAWQAATTDVTLGHQGLSLDAETGLYYNRARMLHPTLGVFTGRDLLGYVDGGSLYEYVRGNPQSRVDPTGLKSCRDIRCFGDITIKRHFANAISAAQTVAKATKVLCGLVGHAIAPVNALRKLGDIADATPGNRAIFYTVIVYDCKSCNGERLVNSAIRNAYVYSVDPAGLPGENNLGGFDSTQPNFWTGTLPQAGARATTAIREWLTSLYPSPACQKFIQGVKA